MSHSSVGAAERRAPRIESRGAEETDSDPAKLVAAHAPANRSPAPKVVTAYLMAGVLWILFSDAVLPSYQTLKGILFVVLSAAVVGVVVERSWRARVRIEERHRQMQRLESIGRLAGGIAHDFNNLLTAIRGYTDVLLADAPRDSDRYTDLQQIRVAADRATSLTRQLLAFSRRQRMRRSVVNLNDVVVSTLQMTRRMLPSNIDISSSLDEGVGLVDADPDRLEQMLLNLLVNARDALPEGGEIGIRTAAHTIGNTDRERAEVLTPPGDYVLLEVRDTGPGMDADTLGQIFEPFYTTKETGTGLGLSTCYGIVKQHGGYIWVRSEPGRGTTFTVHLPVAAASSKPDGEPAASVPEARPPAGHERRVLVVDDDLGVRSVAVRALQRGGYRVEETGKPRIAVQMLETATTPFDLLVTDLVMPGLDGLKLARRVSARGDGARVLLITGHAERPDAPDLSGFPLLEKPFAPDELVRKVDELLAARG